MRSAIEGRARFLLVALCVAGGAIGFFAAGDLGGEGGRKPTLIGEFGLTPPVVTPDANPTGLVLVSLESIPNDQHPRKAVLETKATAHSVKAGSAELSLGRAAVADAVVWVEDGETLEPVQGARVRIRVTSEYGENPQSEDFRCKTGPDGKASASVPFGILTVSTLTNDGRFGRSRPIEHFKEGSSVRVSLDRLATVSGVVLDKISGSPIAGAILSNHVTAAIDDEDCVSNEDGSFVFSSWGVSSAAVLTVAAEGYGSGHLTLYVDSENRWALIGDSSSFEMSSTTPYVEVLLEPEVWIQGRMMRTDGSPVKNVRVRAFGTVPASAFISVEDVAETVSAEDGRFLLKGLRIDVPHFVVCETRDEGVSFFRVQEGELVVDLGDVFLSSPVEIEGAVLDLSGQSLVGAQVLVEIKVPSPMSESYDGSPTLDSIGGFEGSGNVDLSGGFKIGGLVAGRATVRITIGGERVAQRELDLAEGERVVLDPFVIEDECSRIEALVVDSEGRLLSGRSVTLLDGGLALCRIKTDAKGKLNVSILSSQQNDGLTFVLLDDNGRADTRWPSQSGVFSDVLRTAK